MNLNQIFTDFVAKLNNNNLSEMTTEEQRCNIELLEGRIMFSATQFGSEMLLDAYVMIPEDLPVEIFGNNRDNDIVGTELDEIINGRRGDDLLDGGEGNDELFGGRGSDTLIGGEGNDALFGNRVKTCSKAIQVMTYSGAAEGTIHCLAAPEMTSFGAAEDTMHCLVALEMTYFGAVEVTTS